MRKNFESMLADGLPCRSASAGRRIIVMQKNSTAQLSASPTTNRIPQVCESLDVSLRVDKFTSFKVFDVDHSFEVKEDGSHHFGSDQFLCHGFDRET